MRKKLFLITNTKRKKASQKAAKDMINNVQIKPLAMFTFVEVPCEDF